MGHGKEDWLRLAGHNVVQGIASARAENAMCFVNQARLVGDVHGSVLRDHYVKREIGKRQARSVALLKAYAIGESGSLRQFVPCRDELFGQVEHGDATTDFLRERASGAANTAADVENFLLRPNPSKTGEFERRRFPARVELV
jgi:hypothetical protein